MQNRDSTLKLETPCSDSRPVVRESPAKRKEKKLMRVESQMVVYTHLERFNFMVVVCPSDMYKIAVRDKCFSQCRGQGQDLITVKNVFQTD